MAPRLALLPLTAALVLQVSPARAQPHQVCLYLDIGDLLWDASPRAADGEDFREEYGRNEGPTSYPAQRWLARVEDETTGASLFGWEPLDGSGCADVELPDGGETLTLEWLRWAAWDDEPETGNQVIGYHCRAETGDCTLEIQRRTMPADPAGVTAVTVAAIDVIGADAVLWAASFAEERFASMDGQPLYDTRIYVGHDPATLIPGKTQADRMFGNQPSVVIQGDGWHSKYTAAHEYGHLQTLVAHHDAFSEADLDYCYDAAAYPATSECMSGHMLESHEWQSAAAIEGLANWYAVSAWNDVDAVECQNCQPGVRFVHPTSATEARDYIVPRGDSLCGKPPECPPGVGNEWDWVSALRLFRLSIAPPPDFRSMFRMLAIAYDHGGWTPNAPSQAFWTNFDQAMVAHLGGSYPAWRAAATAMEIDR